MCFSIPAKVISSGNKKIIVERTGQREEIKGSLVKIKKGDYVFLKNNFIVGKISKKEAKEIINLIKAR